MLFNTKTLTHQKPYSYFIRKRYPSIGYWYSAAYLDSKTISNCSVELSISFDAHKQNNVKILRTNRKQVSAENLLLNYYKYFYKETAKPCLTFEIKFSESHAQINCSLIAYIRESRIPNSSENEIETFNWFNDFNSSCTIKLVNAVRNKWYYLLVKSVSGQQVTILPKSEDEHQSVSNFRHVFKAFRQVKNAQTIFLFNSYSSLKTNELMIENERPNVIEFFTNENDLGHILNIGILVPLVQDSSRIEHSLQDRNSTDSFSQSETILLHICLLKELSTRLVENCSKNGSGLILSFKRIYRRNKSQTLLMKGPRGTKNMINAVFPRIGPWYLVFKKECITFDGQVIKCKPINVIHAEFVSIESNPCAVFDCNNSGECKFNQSYRPQACECRGGN